MAAQLARLSRSKGHAYEVLFRHHIGNPHYGIPTTDEKPVEARRFDGEGKVSQPPVPYSEPITKYKTTNFPVPPFITYRPQHEMRTKEKVWWFYGICCAILLQANKKKNTTTVVLHHTLCHINLNGGCCSNMLRCIGRPAHEL
jgi:hypothetical protein